MLPGGQYRIEVVNVIGVNSILEMADPFYVLAAVPTQFRGQLSMAEVAVSRHVVPGVVRQGCTLVIATPVAPE